MRARPGPAIQGRMSTLPVKICCIQDEHELDLAVSAGADALGFVSAMPSGWGPISDARIAALCRRTPPFLVSVLLTSRTSVQGVIEQQRQCRANALQICDRFPEDGYGALREALPGVQLIKVVHVNGEEAIAEARRLAPQVDGLILDSGGASHAGEVALGGTGRTHDWSISARIVASVACPVILAGGLKAHNLAQAVGQVRPFGIDLCTGVRTDFALDPAKLRTFMGAVRELRSAL